MRMGLGNGAVSACQLAKFWVRRCAPNLQLDRALSLLRKFRASLGGVLVMVSNYYYWCLCFSYLILMLVLASL